VIDFTAIKEFILNTTATKSFTGWSPATFAAEDLFEQHSKTKAAACIAINNPFQRICFGTT
jgi:hypothetical protein